jgi:hypothetical protein
MATTAALAPQQNITQHWDVVIKTDRMTALGTMGSGKNDGFLPRQPVNTYIQETPDD